MEEFHSRLTAMRRDMSTLETDVGDLRKKKANEDDLDVIAKKLSAVETESRERSQTLHADINDLRRAMLNLGEAVNNLNDSLTRHKRDFPAPSATLNTSVSLWERIPKWMWLLVGVGALALLQEGPAWLEKLRQVAGP